MGRISTFGQHLYEGRVSFDFVGRRKLWYSISALILVVAALGVRAPWLQLRRRVQGRRRVHRRRSRHADSATSDACVEAVEEAGVPEAGDPTVQTSGDDLIRIQTRALSQDEATKITDR